MTTPKKPAKSIINGKQETGAADVPSPVPTVESFVPNGDQQLSLNITQGWTPTDWTNIFGGLSVAQANAHQTGNVAEMFSYMRYTQQIGARLNPPGFMLRQQTKVSDLSPPNKARAAGMGG